MKLSPVLLLLLVASPEMRYFRYQRPIQAPAAGQICVPLDPAIFSHASAGLADLRLYRDGKETPYVLHQAAPASDEEQSLDPLNLGRNGGQTVFDAQMPSGSYSDLQLSISGQDFIATATVSGSQQQTGPDTRIGAFTIFDLTRQRLGRSTVLHLPPSDFRYLHFRIQGPLPPQSVTGLSILRLPSLQPRYVTVAQSNRFDQNGRVTEIAFTVPPHTPVDRIVFVPAAQPASFSREVGVTVTSLAQPSRTESGEPPRPFRAYGSLLRVHRNEDGHRLDEERLQIDAPAVDFDAPAKWVVTVQNGDDAPLRFDAVRLEMTERDLCFDSTGPGTYLLAYGDPALAAPRYDYAALFSPQAAAAAVAAGPEQPNPGWQPRPDERPFTERHPALLWIALVAVIVLLAVVAFRSARRPSQPS
jgi:hypothetical protein